jgi:AraC-like DNA-binding protein
MDERTRGRAVPFDTLPRQRLGDGASWLRGGGSGPLSVLICGGVSLGGYIASALTRILPEILVLRADHTTPIVGSALEAMRAEARAARPGSLTLMTRLADVIVIHAVRGWLDTAHAETPGWLAALRDPQIGAAIAEIHQSPGTRWTLEALARSARMSRTTVSERFTELVGVSPMQYVTEVRMQRAREILEREPLGVGQIAARLGYESESAFARAFKRHIGTTPGSVRRESARRSKLA